MWTAGVLVLVFIAITAALAVAAHHIEPFLHAVLVQGLENRFRTRVELDSFHVSLGNGLHGEWGIWATGKGLRIWPPRREGGDHPLEVATQSIPLIDLESFRFHAPLSYRADRPIRISVVRLSGLAIHVPPRSERDSKTGFEAAAKSAAGTGSNAPATGAGQSGSPAPSSGDGMLSRVQLDRIECDRTDLVLETDKPNKLPVEMVIKHLHVMHVSAAAPMNFEADVINPKPSGTVHTTGQLGPWLGGDPGETTVSGTYSFPNADMSVFRGIAGMLTSEGSYSGSLRNLAVNGQADVPDFRLTHFGNAVPLHTKFQAHVDGTDGDTYLDRVDAVLGQSHFTTSGKIVRVKAPERPQARQIRETHGIPAPVAGHDIELKVDVGQGRMEDFLRLAGHSPTTLLTGVLGLKAMLHIPPGSETVHKRIRIDGSFKLDDVSFTNDKVRDRIRELSLRGQGKPGELKSKTPDDVSSEMEGEFHMANAVIQFPDLEYNVPGAAIRLNGHYDLDGMMGFAGTARMQATVSQMVGGWKGFLLKPADRFFKRGGTGTEVGIEIRGPHDAPQFSVDLKGTKTTSPERPGEKKE